MKVRFERERRQHRDGAVRRFVSLCLLFCVGLLAGQGGARALEGIPVPPETPAIDLTNLVERVDQRTDRIQVSTAPGVDGLVRRIEVRAQEPGAPSAWA
ncbi:MAG TPA: hypothetical protein VK844_05230, partial [Hyphomicrobiales bacterium]|nr:hypothetical protein [Hyphomicrobiales bacterium]